MLIFLFYYTTYPSGPMSGRRNLPGKEQPVPYSTAGEGKS